MIPDPAARYQRKPAPRPQTTSEVVIGQASPQRQSQLDLFARTEKTRQLEEENAWLRARLDTAGEKYRELRDTTEALEHERDEARRERDEAKARLASAEDMAKFWQHFAGAYSQGKRASVGAHAALDTTLRHLLTVAHPDKWAQGQPAQELAHELTVAINGLRQRRGG